MVRTIVIPIEKRAARFEKLGDVQVDAIDQRFVEKSARDTRLIRDHHGADAGTVQRTNRGDAPRVEHHALGPVEVADLVDERAVAIEKDRRLYRRGGRLLMTSDS